MGITFDQCKEFLLARGCPFCGKTNDNLYHSIGTFIADNGGKIDDMKCNVLVGLTCNIKRETETYNPDVLEHERQGTIELARLYALASMRD